MTGQLTGRVVKAALFPHARLEFAHELAAVLARRVQLFHEFLLADHKIKLDAFDLVKGLANAGGQACGGHRKRLRGIARARTQTVDLSVLTIQPGWSARRGKRTVS